MLAGKMIDIADTDRLGETLQVTIVACDDRILTAAVPNTIVRFNLYRQHNASYEGSLGGRNFSYFPAHEKRHGQTKK